MRKGYDRIEKTASNDEHFSQASLNIAALAVLTGGEHLPAECSMNSQQLKYFPACKAAFKHSPF